MKKRTYAITGAVIAVIMVTLLVLVISANRQSDKELAEVDAFIAQYETKTEAQTETRSWTKLEAPKDEEETTTALLTHTVNLDDFATEETETEEVPAYSVEELADHVLNVGLNGPDREEYLGERYEEVQKYIDETHGRAAAADSVPDSSDSTDSGDSGCAYDLSGNVLNPYDGINYYYGTLETYYNMDMSGVVDWMHSLGYGGDYWVRSDGVKMLGDYVMVAADYDQYPKGTVVETSLGTGLVCDTGMGGYDWFDIATDW